MSAAAIALSEDTVHKLVVAQSHVGAENVDQQMERYVWSKRVDGQHIINLQYTWDKIVLAARIIAAIENPKDVAVVCARDWGQRAVLKFASHIGATPIAGRFTPGTFTNQQQQKDFKEPRLIIVTDTRIDHQPLLEASYVNVPTIAFANSDSPIQYVDVVIPCNNAAPQSIGLIYWLLCREVMRIKGIIPRNQDWEVMPDLFFWRDPAKEEENKQEENAALEAAAAHHRNAAGGGQHHGGGGDVNPFAALSGAQDTMKRGQTHAASGGGADAAWTEDNSAPTSQRASFAPWGAAAGAGGAGAAHQQQQQQNQQQQQQHHAAPASGAQGTDSEDPNAMWSALS